MGIIYVGPIDGHNIKDMLEAFRAAARIKNRPVLVHVVTKKGKGYLPAENNPSAFHGVGRFLPKTGEIEETGGRTYTDVFGDWMVKKGKQCPELVSVCAAMPDGTGVKEFAVKYPGRFFDVGIAEEHAVTFAAGLMAGGMRPVVSIYSTFLQRAYDQLIHDICLNELPVIFAVDRSGIVGRDGDTHQGIFDISYLTSIPNMTVLSPMSGTELEQCLDFAYDHNGPVAVRYPRGDIYEEGREEIICEKPWELGRARILMVRGRLLEEKEEADPGQIKGDAVLLAVGNMTKTALDVGRLLLEKNIYCTVVNMRFVKPFDKELLLDLVGFHQMVATLEDNVKNGGFGQQAEALFVDEGCVPEIFLNCSIDDCFVEHGAPEELYERLEMDAGSVAEKIERMLREKT